MDHLDCKEFYIFKEFYFFKDTQSYDLEFQFKFFLKDLQYKILDYRKNTIPRTLVFLRITILEYRQDYDPSKNCSKNP